MRISFICDATYPYVLLCFIQPIFGNRYGPGVSSSEPRETHPQLITLNLNRRHRYCVTRLICIWKVVYFLSESVVGGEYPLNQASAFHFFLGWRTPNVITGLSGWWAPNKLLRTLKIVPDLSTGPAAAARHSKSARVHTDCCLVGKMWVPAKCLSISEPPS